MSSSPFVSVSLQNNRQSKPKRGSQAFNWRAYAIVCACLLVGSVVFALGVISTTLLPAPIVEILLWSQLIWTVALIITMMIERLRPAALPIGVVVMFCGGLSLPASAEHALLLLITLLVNWIVLSLMARYTQFSFGSLGVVLAVLAIVLSLAGVLLVYPPGVALITIPWAIAAIVCLDALICQVMSALRQPASGSLMVALPVVLIQLSIAIHLLALITVTV